MEKEAVPPVERTILFEQLVKENMRRAYFTALGLTGSHDLAMEISQEAFLRAYKSFSRFDTERNFFTWYYKILKNLWLNLKRGKKRKRVLRFLEVKNELYQDDSMSNYEQEELKDKLEKAIQLLPEEFKEIIILREFENTDYKDIAVLLHIPQGTVMSRLFYARKKLAELMRSMV